MSYDYQSKDGLCRSNNADFVHAWNNTIDEYNENERQWIADLESQGVKASHPDDGWVDRQKNIVFLCYPQFNNYPEIGDTIALGSAYSGHRLVKVVEVIPCYYGTHRTRYAFKQIEQPKEEKKANWFMRLLFGE
ncbi:hypothetical protein Kirov_216 [Bacillus phage Kirov]|uniref:Uncharacterized protein n=1 Tax=Bacillus phage Kirov TaxID=2783539 RepID=A0A7U3RWK9_9CAUD|nr:hypothetical protein PQE67_gp088 [Bacillus phage Kirov]QOV08415.1 hypothetical protein Kirov_216 [Bacillus phage Kirov]